MKNYCQFPGKFAFALSVCEVGVLIIFGFFVRYEYDYGMPKGEKVNPVKSDENMTNLTTHMTIVEAPHHASAEEHVEQYYPMFEDIHIMMFIGFGFLMTFLKRYSWSSVGLNFMVAAFVLQWDTIIHGWIDHFDLYESEKLIPVNLKSIIKADFSAAAVLISFGAVLGKISPLQLLIMSLFEIVFYEGNQRIVFGYLKATDAGDSMVVHAFGAYFGIVVAWILYSKDIKESEDREGAVYQSDIFAMIGTIFLWICWPSFNSATVVNEGRVRAIINTYYALTASCVTAFAISSLVDKKNKFSMVHVQNSTLAGGVAIGSVADMLIQPWAAILVGMVAGFISVVGYQYLTPAMAKYLKIHDTCGVNNLHGIPGIISGLGSVLAAGIATKELYKDGLEYIFEGQPRTTQNQAGIQAACLGISLGFAIVGGAITGAVLRIPIFDQPRDNQLFDDQDYWIIHDEEEHKAAEDGHHYNDEAFTKV